MPLYKKFIIIIANTFFKFLLFFAISVFVAVILYTDKDYIPSVLNENRTYERLVGALLETNKEQSLTAGGDITLEDEQIQEIIKDSFPASDLKVKTESVISSIYDWLENKEANLNFEIDLTKNKQKLAEGLSSFAVNRLEMLSECSEIPQQIDPFSADCRPPNIDLENEKENIKQQLLNESGFLDEPVITQDTVLASNENQNFNEDYRNLPTYFSLIKASPIYIGLVLLLLALIVIFTSSTKKIGIRKIGRGILGASVSLIFFTFIFSFILPSITGSLPIFQAAENGIDSLLNDLSIAFGQDYSLMIIYISIPLMIIGSLMILYSNLNKNKKDYKSAKLKSGLVNSNQQPKKASQKKKITPPVQSSESSNTKPKKRYKNKRYRKVPKKEI